MGERVSARERRRRGAREKLQGVLSSDGGIRRWRCRAWPHRCLRVRRKKTRGFFRKPPGFWGILENNKNNTISKPF
jgi:hypothetical protein